MTSLSAQEARRLRAKAKSAILRWSDTTTPTTAASARAVLSCSIDKMLAELPNRDAWFEVRTVLLGETHDFPFAVRGATWRAYPCADMLAVTTVVPGWAHGWRPLLPDEAAYDTLTWFLHYARQYIHRAHVAKILMVAWDRDDRVVHPFGPKGTSRGYGPWGPVPSIAEMLDEAEADAKREYGAPDFEQRIRSRWTKANTLDPNLHQAIFHFTRGQSLLAHEFELEAVVAFDCALQAIKSLFVHGGQLPNKASRAALCAALGLSLSDGGIATEGNFLRNTVGAHAGGWRWWDSGEFTEDLASALSKATRRALAKAAAIEPNLRQIDPAPSSWSDWLLVHFDLIWEAVWFEKMRDLK